MCSEPFVATKRNYIYCSTACTVKAAGKSYRSTNPSGYQAIRTKYRQSAKGKATMSRLSAERRFAKKKAFVSWADRQKVQYFYEEAQRLTYLTGISHHVDHVIPLVSDVVCGLHNEFNLQILVGEANLRKGNTYSL